MDLFQEVLYHANFCMETAEKFNGRRDLLNEIQTYFTADDINTPLVCYGNSGCGKTAILAKIATQVKIKNFIFK